MTGKRLLAAIFACFLLYPASGEGQEHEYGPLDTPNRWTGVQTFAAGFICLGPLCPAEPQLPANRHPLGTSNLGQPICYRLVGTDLPLPTPSSLGGIESFAQIAHEWLNSISTSGVPAASQPAFPDISGSVACAQLPGLTGYVTSAAGTCQTNGPDMIYIQGAGRSQFVP